MLIFIHNDADKYWLTWSLSYTSKNKFRLNIKSDTEAFARELKVAEKQIKFYPKEKDLARWATGRLPRVNPERCS